MYNTIEEDGNRWNFFSTLQWGYNERDGVSNHQHHDCLLNLLVQI